MDYNKFAYYRANPYFNQGYMPPIAHQNRHKPDFITELPMGEEHLSKIGRRQYQSGFQKSQIEQEDLLKSPERYPFENRIALDKSYERNLNTIDIEGASSSTLISPAVRNKMKAREQLIKRQNLENNNSEFEHLKYLEGNEQQRRRKVAYQQYLKSQQLSQLNAGRMPAENKNEDKYRSVDYGQRNEILMNKKNIRPITPERDYPEYQEPRYQSIDVQRLYNPQSDLAASSNRFSQSGDRQASGSLTPRQEAKQPYYYPLPKNKKELRQNNPTNLSSEGSIYLAGKNIVGR